MNNNFKKVSIIYVFLILLSLAVIWKIFYLQYIEKAEITDIDISYKIEEIEAKRGSIFSSDGRPLSTSVPYFQIRMDCVVISDTLFNNNIDALCRSLSQLYKDKSAAAYKAEIIKARKEEKRYKPIGNRLVDYTEMLEIRKFPIFSQGQNRGGLITEQRNRRKNPYGRLAYRTIGFINNNGEGTGIERSYDAFLKGRPGRQTVQRILGGEWIPATGLDVIQPEDGFDIQTTLDIDIQEAAEDALRDQLSKSDVFEGATAIVMEVKTGAIRAIANMKKGVRNDFDESYNYAIGHSTEPGSTFKLATLIALIEDGYVNLESKVDAGNGRWRYISTNFTDVTRVGYGVIDVKTAFEKSSNVAFAKLVTEHYGNNEKRYVNRIVNMKLTERFNLDILGEARAVIYSPDNALWSRISLPMMSIGYFSLLTPLHTLTFYNAVANNGKMMKPYFIENLQKNGVIHQKFGSQEITGSICSKRTLDQVQNALRGVVENGTAKAIDDPRYQISGKTGTAQIAFDGKYKDASGNRKHQASFAGYFPSDNPKYSMIVVLYTNKTRDNFYGGAWAAPVFKRIADKIYARAIDWNDPLTKKDERINTTKPDLYGDSKSIRIISKELDLGHKIDTKNSSWIALKEDKVNPITINNNMVPDVRGMGLKDAIYILENMGYRVSFSGRGKIVAQNPEPNIQISKGSIIQLTLER